MDESSPIIKDVDNNKEEHVPRKALSESPVLNALRSHIQRWYPEIAKHNNLEVDDILDEAV